MGYHNHELQVGNGQTAAAAAGRWAALTRSVAIRGLAPYSNGRCSRVQHIKPYAAFPRVQHIKPYTDHTGTTRVTGSYIRGRVQWEPIPATESDM